MNITGYKITRNYSKLTIWHFSRMTQGLMMTETVTPIKGLSREEKYEEIYKALQAVKPPIPCPVYQPLAKTAKP